MSVGQEEHPLGAEDDDVVCCGHHGEEEHFELKAHPEEDSTRDKRQDAAIYGVLRKREAGSGVRPGSNNKNRSSYNLFQQLTLSIC